MTATVLASSVMLFIKLNLKIVNLHVQTVLFIHLTYKDIKKHDSDLWMERS